MRNKQDLFSAIFESYEDKPVKVINLKEIRTRFGGEVKRTLTFEADKVENFPSYLNAGEYAAFVADLEFRNVRFLNIMSVRGDYGK